MKRITIELPEELVEAIDQLAGYGKRTKWIRQALEKVVKEAET